MLSQRKLLLSRGMSEKEGECARIIMILYHDALFCTKDGKLQQNPMKTLNREGYGLLISDMLKNVERDNSPLFAEVNNK